MDTNGHDPIIRMTEGQLDKLTSSLIENMGRRSGEIATLAASEALEQFASALEAAPVNASSPENEPIVKAVIGEIVSKARSVAQTIRSRGFPI